MHFILYDRTRVKEWRGVRACFRHSDVDMLKCCVGLEQDHGMSCNGQCTRFSLGISLGSPRVLLMHFEVDTLTLKSSEHYFSCFDVDVESRADRHMVVARCGCRVQCV
jgi:hypothetical protein